MKRLLFFLSIGLFTAISCTKSTQDAATITFDSLKTLDGHWKSEFDDNNVMRWENQDSLLVGTVFSTKNNDTSYHEMHTIEFENDSLVYDVMLIHGPEPTDIKFKFSHQKDNHYVFTSDERDFPNTLTFQLIDKDTIIIGRKGTISGIEEELKESYFKQD